MYGISLLLSLFSYFFPGTSDPSGVEKLYREQKIMGWVELVLNWLLKILWKAVEVLDYGSDVLTKITGLSHITSCIRETTKLCYEVFLL